MQFIMGNVIEHHRITRMCLRTKLRLGVAALQLLVHVGSSPM